MSNNARNQAQWTGTGDPDTYNETSLTIQGDLGKYLTVKERTGDTPVDGGDVRGRDKEYRKVRVDSAPMAVLPDNGIVAFWANKARFVVSTTPTAQGRGRVAGIFKNPVPLGSYCFVQVGGPALVKFQGQTQGQAAPTATPTAAGLIVIPSAFDGRADCLAAGSAATYPIIGYSAGAMDATNYTATVDLAIPDLP